MSTLPIQYEPLDTDKAEIRVLVIEKADRIVCKLQTVSLAEANPFYALSYVWGDANDLQSITLNGQLIKVRKNLCDFLWNLSHALQTPIRVWVDYLCINQDDLDERASQVAMMGQIYSKADSVYAWLGSATADSDKIVDFLNQSKLQRLAGQSYEKIYMSDSTVFHALNDLLRRPYWSRLWIIQEIVLAKRLWLFCGSKYISWHDLLFVLGGSKGFGPLCHQKDSLHDATKLMQHLKESRESSRAMSLSELVHKFIRANCQDDRDKIYGLLSLTCEEQRHLVKVDYRRPILQVLLETYHHWASEWVLDQDDIRGTAPATRAYTPSLFCQELGLLFSEHQLLALYDDLGLRQQVTANVTFKGFWQVGTFFFKYLATIPLPGEHLVPIHHRYDMGEDMLSSPIVSQVVTSNGHDVFTYTTVAPLPTDRIINIGPIMLIIRQKNNRYFIAGRGIQQRCPASQYIFDPRLWRAQLLQDSIFDLKHDVITEPSPNRYLAARSKDNPISIVLNAAALIEVLIATKEQDRTWRPHDFGLQHKMLDMCRDCRVTTQFGRRGSDTKLCRCTWIGDKHTMSSTICVK